MDNIEMLYTGGCSFTRMASKGEHPQLEEQWPHLLAKKLGSNVINDALWNGSNPRTFRKLYEFLTTQKYSPKNTLVLIQFTFTWRFEIPSTFDLQDYAWPESPHKENWLRINPGHFDLEQYQEHQDLNAFKGCVALRENEEKPIHKTMVSSGLQKVYAKLLDYTDDVEKLELLTQIFSIKGLLENYGVNYKFLFGEGGKWNDEIAELVGHFLTSTPLRLIAGEYTTIDNYHADKQGNIQTADTLYDLLMNHTDK